MFYWMDKGGSVQAIKNHIYLRKAKKRIETMPPNCTPTDKDHIKPHEPWCQYASIHLFQVNIRNVHQIRLEYE